MQTTAHRLRSSARCLVGALLLTALMVPGCNHGNKRDDRSAGSSAGSSAKAQKELPGKGLVTFSPGGKTLRVAVEIVESEAGRAKGLMYRKKLGASEGMLFIFPTQQVQYFWMKNTYIPLDMIFVDENTKRVVGVVENAEPMTEVSRHIDKPSRYVVEVNAGFAKRHGIGPGTPMEFRVDTPPKMVR